jgi:hypothetical protein
MTTNKHVVSDKKICPKCGKDNHCAIENQKNQDRCWCTNIHVSTLFIMHLSELYPNQGCFCQTCLEKEMMHYNLSKIDSSK